MKPPWIDQGWSLVAGALANRGVHPPPTTSRPSLPSRCGCTPDCLRSPPPLSRDSSLSLFPFLDSYARGLQGYRRNTPLAPHASSLAHAIVALPAVPRPPKPTSLAANPSVNDHALPPPRVDTENHRRPRALAPGAFPTQPRPSLSLESPQGPLGSQG